MTPVRIGFLPLSDAAVLVAAAEQGFAAAEGIALELVREVSWANVRDKLNIGLFEAAHMLAPLAVASGLGLTQARVPLVVPFALNLNGNAITVSTGLHVAMDEVADGNLAEPAAAARALAAVAASRRRDGRDPLTFGTVFPFSTHTYLLRHWLWMGGLDPDEDIRLRVIPPPHMAESLRGGLLDGFCVGSPWNSVAVEAGVGRIVALGVDIVARAPEKVFALPAGAAEREPDMLDRLVRALDAAGRWCAAPENRSRLARILAEPRYLGLPAETIRRTLNGKLAMALDGPVRRHPDFLVFARDGAGRPDPRHAVWLYAQMVRAGQTTFSPRAAVDAAALYRPDLYDAAVGASVGAMSDTDPVGARSGPAFHPDDIAGYFAVR